MLLYGSVGVEHFDEALISDARIVSLAHKVRVVSDVTQSDQDRQARVELRLVGGETLTGQKKHALGHPCNPGTWSDLVEKFECVAAPVVGAKTCKDVVSMVNDLDELEDIARLQAVIS
jgi:2-methylcitrate dehydratase PrpD